MLKFTAKTLSREKLGGFSVTDFNAIIED